MPSSSPPQPETSLATAEPLLTAELLNPDYSPIEYLPPNRNSEGHRKMAWLVGLFLFVVLGGLLAAVTSQWSILPATALAWPLLYFTLDPTPAQRRLERQPDGDDRVTVGDDGVAVFLDGLSGSRSRMLFVPLEQLERVAANHDTLCLRWTRGACDLLAKSAESTIELVERIDRGRRRLAHFQHELDEIEQVNRLLLQEQEDARGWSEQLTASLSHDEGYRHAAAVPEEMGALLGNPLANTRARVCVAVALGTARPSEYRAAIERAASRTANAPLREALRAAADGHLDEKKISAAERWRKVGC